MVRGDGCVRLAGKIPGAGGRTGTRGRSNAENRSNHASYSSRTKSRSTSLFNFSISACIRGTSCLSGYAPSEIPFSRRFTRDKISLSTARFRMVFVVYEGFRLGHHAGTLLNDFVSGVNRTRRAIYTPCGELNLRIEQE